MHVSKQPIQERSSPAPRGALFHIGRALLILLLLIVVVVSAAVIFHRSLLRAYAPGLLATVKTQYRDYYDLGLEWTGYGITGISDFTISGLKLTDLATGLELVKCDAMHIQSSIAALTIRGSDPMQAITSVELDHLVVTIGRKNGLWDTGKLFVPSTRPKVKFPGSLGVVIRNGAIVWLGGEVSSGLELPQLQMAGLQGSYSQDVDGGMGMRIAGTLTGSQVEPGETDVKAIYNPKTRGYEVTCNIKGLDLKLIAPYLDQYGLKHVTGLADTSMSLLAGPGVGKSGYSLLGKASVRNGALHYDDYNFDATDVAGDIHFSHTSLFTTGLTGQIEGSAARLRGRMGDFGNMRYDMVADGTNIGQPLARKILPDLKQVPVDGPLDAHVEFSGASGDWDVLVEASSPALVSAHIPFRLNDILAWYSKDKVTFKRAEASLASGKVVADGVLDLSGQKTSYRFHAVGSGIGSGQFRSMLPASDAGYVPNGSMSADVTIASVNGSPPTATGLLQMPEASLAALSSMPPMDVSFPFTWKGNRFEFKGASAKGGRVSILADGQYSVGGNATAKIAATVDDPGFVGRVTSLPLSARIAIAGDFVYAEKEGSSFGGDGILSDFQAGPVSSGQLSAKVAYKSGVVHLSEFDGLVAGAKINGDLAIPITGNASGAKGSFALQGLDVGPFLPSPYARAVSTSLGFHGNLASATGGGGKGFEVDILITEPGARVGSNLVSTVGDGVSVKVEFPPDLSGISSIALAGNLKSRPSGAPIYAGRVLTPYGERVVGEITRILMGKSEPAEMPPSSILPAISGVVALKGLIHDPLGKTHGDVTLASESLTVEGYTISSGSIGLSSGEGDRWNLDLQAHSDSAGSFEISGEVDRGPTLLDSTLALTAAIHDSGLNQIFQIMGLTQFGQFTGSMNGSGAIGGTIGSPVVSDFKVDLSQSEAFGVHLNQGGATFGYEAPVLNLTNLDLEGDNGFRALGAGSIDLGSPSLANASLVLRLDQFNLDYVRKILGPRFPLGGTVSGTVQLARDALGTKVLYNATIAQAAMHIDGASLVFGDVSVDAMTRPESPDVTLNSFKLSRESQEVLVKGTLPVSFLSKSSFSIADLTSGGKLDLDITSDTGYTPPVPSGIVASGISWEGGLGPVHLTLNGADLEGDIALDVGKVKLGEITLLNGLKGTMHAVNSIISASPDEVKILGDGWELGVQGQTNLLTMCIACPGSARFAVTGTTPGPIKLAGKGYSFQLEPGTEAEAPALVADGPWQNLSARITGVLNVKGGSVDISQIPPIFRAGPPAKAGPLAFGFKLNLQGDMTVTSGDTFSFAFDRGSLGLTGPATDPVLSGTLTAPSGWLDILGNHFVLTDPLVMDFSSFYRFDPHVTAAAQVTLREVRSPQNFGQEVVVTAKIDGRMSNMLDHMQLTSQPSLSQDQLLAALAYEDVVFRTLGGSIFGEGFGAPGIQDLNLKGVALPLASAYLSRYIRKRAGLSDFEVSVDPQKRTYIYVEKQVLESLVAYYRQTFATNASAYLFGLRYRFRPRSWVTLEIDNKEDITGQVQYIVPLN